MIADADPRSETCIDADQRSQTCIYLGCLAMASQRSLRDDTCESKSYVHFHVEVEIYEPGESIPNILVRQTTGMVVVSAVAHHAPTDMSQRHHKTALLTNYFL